MRALNCKETYYREWLSLIGLPEYVELFESQGYYSMSEVQKLTWEDFEDIGIKKLGHLKRLGLAIKKMKVCVSFLWPPKMTTCFIHEK